MFVRVLVPLLLLLPALFSGTGCRDGQAKAPSTATPLSEEVVRRITREEIERALASQESTAAAGCDLASAVGRARPSVVQVEVKVRGTAIVAGTGTGFVALAGGLVVTAAHVVDIAARRIPGGMPEVTLITVDGRRVAALVVQIDAKLDLAVVRAADLRLPAMRWADSSAVPLGESVGVIGFPVGRTGVTVAGGVLANRVAAGPGRREELISDANADPGDSGGPLLTKCGEALGVVVERRVFGTTPNTVSVGAATALPFVLSAAKDVASASPTPATTP